jgi:septal ring factor EnvC (AmiA/AmiB activator)
MPFDPTKPAFGSPDSSAEMRDQLNALKAMIDAQAAQINSLQSQISGVLAQTSSNSDGVANLSLTIANNPPQQYEVQPIADKLDELINALRR